MIGWIADHLSQEEDDGPDILTLSKRTLEGNNDGGKPQWRDVPVDTDPAGADWATLKDAWSDLPDVASARREDWPKYEEAFQLWAQRNQSNAPPWVPVATFRDREREASARRQKVFSAHMGRIDALVKGNQIEALKEDRTPATKIDHGVMLPVGAASAYLKQCGLALEIANPHQHHGVAGCGAAILAGYSFRGELPDKQFFTIDEVTTYTSLAAYPNVAEDLDTAAASGFFLTDAETGLQLLSIGDNWDELDAIWSASNLPEPRFPMEQYTADCYVLAVAQSRRGTEWKLGKTLHSQKLDAAANRAQVMAQHQKQLGEAIRLGQLRALHPGHFGALSSGEVESVGLGNVLITRADVVQFAARMPAAIELVKPNDSGEGPALEPDKRDAIPMLGYSGNPTGEPVKYVSMSDAMARLSVTANELRSLIIQEKIVPSMWMQHGLLNDKRPAGLFNLRGPRQTRAFSCQFFSLYWVERGGSGSNKLVPKDANRFYDTGHPITLDVVMSDGVIVVPELERFAESYHGVAATTAQPAPAPVVAVQPKRMVKAYTMQDDNIIAALVARGIDPMKMPKAPLGKEPWPLREALMKELKYSKPVISKALGRMRKEGRIKDA